MLFTNTALVRSSSTTVFGSSTVPSPLGKALPSFCVKTSSAASRPESLRPNFRRFRVLGIFRLKGPVDLVRGVQLLTSCNFVQCGGLYRRSLIGKQPIVHLRFVLVFHAGIVHIEKRIRARLVGRRNDFRIGVRGMQRLPLALVPLLPGE